MNNGAPTSFSPARRWSISLNVALSVAAAVAVVLMMNYLAARHFHRLPLSGRAQAPFSALTRQVLGSITNEIKVTIFYDRDEPLYDSIWAMLKEYRYANPRIAVEAVDYERNPSRAQEIQKLYKLFAPSARNLVIFDCNGRFKIIDQKRLSDLDVTPLTSGRSREVKRTHFRGELEFTSALLNVASTRTIKVYFLQGHGEHSPENEDKLVGYSRFAGVLQDNNIQHDRLSLLGTNDVPADCQLLIIAGPRDPFPADELEKIDRYLKQGGRLFVLFNYQSVDRLLGLERLLANWGVAVGNNVVLDRSNSITGQDMVVSQFGEHPLMRPFYGSRLYLVMPRSVGKVQGGPSAADAPQADLLATTGESGQVITDIRPGALWYPRPNDFIGTVPLMVAVERGSIRGVSAERGSTRLVVVGESIFLGNKTILELANRDFASHAVNWLLARNELLVGLAPQPIKEYKVSLTRSQMSAVRLLLLAGMPGGVLLAGCLVWLRRRR